MDIKKEIVEIVEQGFNCLSLDGDLEEHYQDTDTLEFRTRENGCVGDEEPGEEDMIEARKTKMLLEHKFGDKVIVEWDTCDEWVYLNVTIKQ